MPDPQSPSLEDLFDTLASPRRRYVLYMLLENQVANADDVGLQIAAWETDESVSEVSDEDHDAVVIDLVHNHLPRLAELGLVEFDRRSGDLVRGDEFDAVDGVVERLRTVDNQSEVGRTPAAAIVASSTDPQSDGDTPMREPSR